MHSGINTGLVVTGEVNPDKGTHGVSGDALNLASRLSDQASAGEILVGQNTYHRAEGYFAFEDLEPTHLKGKTEPVQVYKVLSQKEKPITTRRLSGLRSDLVGRKVELAELSEAVENLGEGQGRIFSICGDAGTGKSRLVEEFKATLDLEEIQWIEGHAYAYAQNIPYFPLIDFLNRVLHIEEGDPAESVKAKLEAGIEQTVGNTRDVVPYLGGLYSLEYPEKEEYQPRALEIPSARGKPGDFFSPGQKSANRLFSGGFTLGGSLLCRAAATSVVTGPAARHCSVRLPAKLQPV